MPLMELGVPAPAMPMFLCRSGRPVRIPIVVGIARRASERIQEGLQVQTPNHHSHHNGRAVRGSRSRQHINSFSLFGANAPTTRAMRFGTKDISLSTTTLSLKVFIAAAVTTLLISVPKNPTMNLRVTHVRIAATKTTISVNVRKAPSLQVSAESTTRRRGIARSEPRRWLLGWWIGPWPWF